MNDDPNSPNPSLKNLSFIPPKPFTLPTLVTQLGIWVLLGFGSFGGISSSDLSGGLQLSGLLFLLVGGYWLLQRSQQRQTKLSSLSRRKH